MFLDAKHDNANRVIFLGHLSSVLALRPDADSCDCWKPIWADIELTLSYHHIMSVQPNDEILSGVLEPVTYVRLNLLNIYIIFCKLLSCIKVFKQQIMEMLKLNFNK